MNAKTSIIAAALCGLALSAGCGYYPMNTTNVRIDQVQSSRLDSTLSGAGNLDLTGQVSDYTVAMAGLGNLHAEGLQSKTARVSVSGAGGASVWATDQLDVTILGAGTVRYRGSSQITRRITGVGSVSRLGD